MKINACTVFFFVAFIFNHFSTYSQEDPDQNELKAEYNTAKNYLVSNRFEESKKSFGQLAKKYENTDYGPYCYYYAAYSNYKSKTLKDANYLSFQLLSKYSDWEYIDQAYYLKAVIQFELRNFPDAFVQLSKIKSDQIKEEGIKAKYQYCNTLSSDSLKLLALRFPDDEPIQKLLQKQVGQNLSSQGYKFNVAVLLPFNLGSKTQFVYDLYTGMMLAKDSLLRRGINLNLFPFETGSDSSKVIEFTKTQNVENFDLIIGPLYTNQQKWMADFASTKSVAVINPLSNYYLYPLNPNYFLFLPSYETQGIKSAQFAFNNFTRKRTAVILYGKYAGDSLIAKAFKSEFERLGGKALVYRKMYSGGAGIMASVLNKIPIDSIGHVFITSQEPSLAANLFTYLEGRLLEKAAAYKETVTERKERKLVPEDIPLLAPNEWLNYQSINYEQFSLHNTHFVFPEYIQSDSLPNRSFINNYFKLMNYPPSTFAYEGFDMIMYYGNALDKYGKELWKYTNQLSLSKGYAMPYLDYSKPGGNQFVPILKIEDYKLKLVNKP